MIYPPNQKPPIWSIDPGIIAYNCQKAGISHPVLAMPMWGGAGNRVFDLSGHGNHGTNYGADWVSDGLYFDGGTDWILAGAGTGLKGINRVGWTIYCIAQWISGTSNEATIGLGDGGSPDGVIIISKSGTIQCYQTNIYRDSGVSTPTEPVSLALTRESSTVGNLYINGVEYSANPTTTSNDAMDFRVARWSDYALYSDVRVHNAFVFNTALSAAQVKFLHDNPYFMYQVPEELYGYVAGAPPETYIPALMNYYRQLRAA